MYAYVRDNPVSYPDPTGMLVGADDAVEATAAAVVLLFVGAAYVLSPPAGKQAIARGLSNAVDGIRSRFQGNPDDFRPRPDIPAPAPPVTPPPPAPPPPLRPPCRSQTPCQSRSQSRSRSRSRCRCRCRSQFRDHRPHARTSGHNRDQPRGSNRVRSSVPIRDRTRGKVRISTIRRLGLRLADTSSGCRRRAGAWKRA